MRFFVLSFKDNKGYPTVDINDALIDVMIDGRNFFDQTTKNDLKHLIA